MPIKPILNENELLLKVAEGDQRAFRVIYDHYYHSIFAYALHLLKSELEAEDVAQATFLKLWLLGERLTKLQNLESFLITISRNHSLDLLRRGQLAEKAKHALRLQWTESHNGTEEQVFLNDARQVLWNAVESLPPRQQQVYRLCHLEGLKYEEVAQRLNLSILTVKSYMKLARHALRKHVSLHTDTGIILLLFSLYRL